MGRRKTAATIKVTRGDRGPIACINERVLLVDSRYLAHAANAYPKLIEALREHVEWLGLADGGKQSPLYQRSAALLRELGEKDFLK